MSATLAFIPPMTTFLISIAIVYVASMTVLLKGIRSAPLVDDSQE